MTFQSIITYLSSLTMLQSKNKGSEFLIIESFNKPEHTQVTYQDRWQSETCLRAMKLSGFDIEKTHLQGWIESLTLIAMIAFVWCYIISLFRHEDIQKIEIEKIWS